MKTNSQTSRMEKDAGQLFVVATPIGNLDDFTFRGAAILKEADLILCEDTRISKRILEKIGVKNKLMVFNARNESRRISEILTKLKRGLKVALISDAGTPAISDPGVRLINACQLQGIPVSGTPGASAAIFALSISGIPTDSFVFEGFLPNKKGRQKKITEILLEKRTVVIYESVYRIIKLLEELKEKAPERFVAVARELTKKFEEVKRGKPAELIDYFAKNKVKGEFVVIIAPEGWQPK